MAWENPKRIIPGAVAAADLSALQYRFVVKNGNVGEYAQNTTEGGPCDGVLQDKPTAQGLNASIASDGFTKVESGDAIAVGDLVVSDDVGRAIPGATTGHSREGRALIAASAAGERITIDLRKFGPQP